MRTRIPEDGDQQEDLTMKRLTLLIVAALVVSRSASGGSVLNVEFGQPGIDYTGLGAAPGTGTVWNYITAPNYFSGPGILLDSTGLSYSDGTAATGITITTTVAVSSYSNGPGLTDNRLFTTGGDPPADVTNPFSLTISGLDPTKTYELYAFGSGSNLSTTYTVGSTSDYAYGQLGDIYPFTLHRDYGLLTGLTAPSGTLTINLSPYGSSQASVFGAFQLATASSVPEPASITLALFGGGGVLCWARFARWRRRTTSRPTGCQPAHA
jgi:PEP-CTERM motif